MTSRLLVLIASLMFCAQVCAASGKPFANPHFSYQANDKSLPDVLQDFGASENVPVVVDAKVSGKVSGKFDTTPHAFLNAMSKAYGIIWYYDGTTLFVYPSGAMESKVFRMHGYTRTQVAQMLSSLGLGDPRFPLRFDDATQTLLAYGPPRHIELVTTVLEQLDRDNRDRLGGSIAVVPLRYATAADRKFGDTQIPGLATALNKLFGNQDDSGQGADAAPPLGAAADSQDIANRMRALQYSYGAKLSPQQSATPHHRADDDDATANALQSAAPARTDDGERPQFQAEPSTNSIIIRGLPDRMPEYRRLIAELDKAQDLVEIDATIIDVSASDFNRLGVDWSYSSHGTTRYSVSPGTPADGSNSSPSDSLSNYNVTTLAGGSAHQLMAHIEALEGAGRARIVSRPQVVAVVNHPATMSDKRTVSAKVAGNLDTSLYQIQAGTDLSVTPQIIQYAEHNEVNLALSIEDGDFENSTVDDIPIVKQTQIDTDATVREGESLLLGGISVDEQSDAYTGLPWVARMPLVGALFRNKQGGNAHEVRLFMLTPKIIKVGEHRADQRPTTHPQSGALHIICHAQDLMVSPNCPVQGY